LQQEIAIDCAHDAENVCGEGVSASVCVCKCVTLCVRVQVCDFVCAWMCVCCQVWGVHALKCLQCALVIVGCACLCDAIRAHAQTLLRW